MNGMKGCPRCGGDLIGDWDFDDGWLLVCLQCGHRLPTLVQQPFEETEDGLQRRLRGSPHVEVLGPGVQQRLDQRPPFDSVARSHEFDSNRTAMEADYERYLAVKAAATTLPEIRKASRMLLRFLSKWEISSSRWCRLRRRWREAVTA